MCKLLNYPKLLIACLLTYCLSYFLSYFPCVSYERLFPLEGHLLLYGISFFPSFFLYLIVGGSFTVFSIFLHHFPLNKDPPILWNFDRCSTPTFYWVSPILWILESAAQNILKRCFLLSKFVQTLSKYAKMSQYPFPKYTKISQYPIYSIDFEKCSKFYFRPPPPIYCALTIFFKMYTKFILSWPPFCHSIIIVRPSFLYTPSTIRNGRVGFVRQGVCNIHHQNYL